MVSVHAGILMDLRLLRSHARLSRPALAVLVRRHGTVHSANAPLALINAHSAGLDSIRHVSTYPSVSKACVAWQCKQKLCVRRIDQQSLGLMHLCTRPAVRVRSHRHRVARACCSICVCPRCAYAFLRLWFAPFAELEVTLLNFTFQRSSNVSSLVESCSDIAEEALTATRRGPTRGAW